MKTVKILVPVFSVLFLFGIVSVVLIDPFKGISRAERLLQEVRHGLHPEFAKLLFIMENYSGSNFKVVFDGTEYHIKSAVARARLYLSRNYRGEVAETWIKNHLYRSPERGEVIYLKFPNGRQRPLRDVLPEDLRRLPL